MTTGGAGCLSWACPESVRGQASDDLSYLNRPDKGASHIVGGNPTWKELTNSPVASLGAEAVMRGLSVDS